MNTYRGQFQTLVFALDGAFSIDSHVWTHDFDARSARAAKRAATKWANSRNVVIRSDPQKLTGESWWDYPHVPRLRLVH